MSTKCKELQVVLSSTQRRMNNNNKQNTDEKSTTFNFNFDYVTKITNIRPYRNHPSRNT